jgi:hypothetical protein
MPFLELFDETLDINSTENYELSVQMSRDGFAFIILDTLRNKYVLLRSHDPDDDKYISADRITELINKDDFLTKSFKTVNVIIPSYKSTLIPSPLYDPGKKEEYFTLNHIREDNELILVNKIPDPDAYIVFSVLKSYNDVSADFYPGVHPNHHTRPLLSQMFHNSRSADGRYVHLHIEREFFNLFVFENNILKFSNAFNFRNISDILYFVLNVFKSLGISNDETVHFSGLTEKYDDIYSNFALYIKNIKFAGPSGNFTFSYVFNDIELHRFINLFTITNCVS